MIEDKRFKHRNKPNHISDAEIMVILILMVSDASNTITRNMSTNIYPIYSPNVCFITNLLNWRKKYYFL